MLLLDLSNELILHVIDILDAGTEPPSDHNLSECGRRWLLSLCRSCRRLNAIVEKRIYKQLWIKACREDGREVSISVSNLLHALKRKPERCSLVQSLALDISYSHLRDDETTRQNLIWILTCLQNCGSVKLRCDSLDTFEDYQLLQALDVNRLCHLEIDHAQIEELPKLDSFHNLRILTLNGITSERKRDPEMVGDYLWFVNYRLPAARYRIAPIEHLNIDYLETNPQTLSILVNWIAALKSIDVNLRIPWESNRLRFDPGSLQSILEIHADTLESISITSSGGVIPDFRKFPRLRELKVQAESIFFHCWDGQDTAARLAGPALISVTIDFDLELPEYPGRVVDFVPWMSDHMVNFAEQYRCLMPNRGIGEIRMMNVNENADFYEDALRSTRRALSDARIELLITPNTALKC